MAAVSRHARCGRHIPHPYGPGGRLCVDQVDCATVTDAERIAWADDLAAIAADHHAAELARPAPDGKVPHPQHTSSYYVDGVPCRCDKCAPAHPFKGGTPAYRRQTDGGLAELAAAFNMRRYGVPARKPVPETARRIVRDGPPEPSKHKRAPSTIRKLHRAFKSSVAADVVGAPSLTQGGRPTCPRCGQSFRKPRHGQTASVGLTWHLENRPSCAADKSRQTAA